MVRQPGHLTDGAELICPKQPNCVSQRTSFEIPWNQQQTTHSLMVYTCLYHPFMVNMVIVFHCSTSITAITGGRAFFWLHSIWMCLKMGHWALATASFREIIIIRWIYMEDLFSQYYVPLYPHFQISCNTIHTCSILYQINYYSYSQYGFQPSPRIHGKSRIFFAFSISILVV